MKILQLGFLFLLISFTGLIANAQTNLFSDSQIGQGLLAVSGKIRYGNALLNHTVVVEFKTEQRDFVTYSDKSGDFKLDLPEGVFNVRILFYKGIEIHFFDAISINSANKTLFFDLNSQDHPVILSLVTEDSPIVIEQPKVATKITLRPNASLNFNKRNKNGRTNRKFNIRNYQTRRGSEQ